MYLTVELVDPVVACGNIFEQTMGKKCMRFSVTVKLLVVTHKAHFIK